MTSVDAKRSGVRPSHEAAAAPKKGHEASATPERCVRRARLAATVCGCAVLGLLTGCTGPLARLEANGESARVIEEASRRRRTIRGGEARALAKALVAVGKGDRARDILALDYQRGGDLDSLEQLAWTEFTMGLRATAAQHYARVAELDLARIEHDSDVCDLWVERGQALIALGEGIAAERVFVDARALCGAGVEDAWLRDEAIGLSERQVRARIHASLCEGPNCFVSNEGPLNGDTAPPRSPSRWEDEATAAQIVERLLADAAGTLRFDPVTDDELRQWLAGKGWDDLAADVMSRSESEAALLQLRLARVLSDLPVGTGGRLGGGPIAEWTRLAVDAPKAEAWRIFAEVGDLVSAEMELGAVYRPAAGPADPERHWSLRVPSSSGDAADPSMLVVARLRRAAGSPDLALELTRDRLATGAVALDVAQAEVLRHVAWGRPWHALAIADAVAADEIGAARAAAVASIWLQEAVCGGPCPDEDDRVVVERVMGASWIERETHSLRHAVSRPPAPRQGGCPSLQERLASDAVGPVPRVLRAMRDDPGKPERAHELWVALESDAGWACAAGSIIPLVIDRGYIVGAARFVDWMALGPEGLSATEVLALAQLAAVAGNRPRAESLVTRAAALTDEPGPVWLAFARTARALGDPGLERIALRAFVSTGDDDVHRRARLELLQDALWQIGTSWAEGHTEMGREALARHVMAELARIDPPQRWGFTDALLRGLYSRPFGAGKASSSSEGAPSWAENPEGWQRLVEVILPDPAVRAAHLHLLRELAGERPSTPASPWDDQGLASEVQRGRRKTVPIEAEVFADPSRFEGLRLALASHARDWGTRRRIAAGLAAYGSEIARVLAFRELGEIADPSGRTRLDDLLLEGVVAMSENGAAALVEDPELLLRVVFDLDLEPSLVAR